MLKDNGAFTITTAIMYPNNRMHVGFGWEVMGADMVARFQRMRGRPVFFSTGLDEHSQNVEKAARGQGMEPQAYCDGMAATVRGVIDQMDIAYDRFIRTSDPDHMKVAQYLIEQAHDAGDVYKQKYEGLYCDGCEVFYLEKDLMAGSAPGEWLCPTHKRPVKQVSEENYFFRLSAYQQQIEKLFAKHGFFEPAHRRAEIAEFVKAGLKDFSVSRTSFTFGVPVPWEKEHVIYVWYDALINYVSAVKYLEDPAFFKKHWTDGEVVHVIGKDITRFHTIFWPAMLLSTQRIKDESRRIKVADRVWAHGFISLNGEKMSKTRGNIVTPDAVIADYGVTALRWYLLSANNFGGDGNYSDEDLILKYNADLANNMGNLVNRTISMSRKYFEGSVPQHRGKLPAGVVGVGERFKAELGGAAALMDEFNLSEYCASVQRFAMALNKFIDETKPWALAKDPAQRDVLETVLAELLEGIRLMAVVLWPVVPAASEAILGQLSLEASLKVQTLHTGRQIRVPQWGDLAFRPGTVVALKDPQPLFPRIEAKKEG